MSLKNYFAIAERVNSISGLTGQEIGGEVESVGYHEQDIIFEQRLIPRVDFSKPENFARYGLASEYYDGAIKRIYGSFPYDGSRQERLEWENESLDIDLYVYQNLYPRTNGYIIFSAEGWGTGNIADGYGSSSLNEYIHFYGGPHPNDKGFTPYATKFTGSNYYEPSKNRESNLKYDIADNGTSVEFWLKKSTFLPTLTRKEVIFDLWNGSPSSSAGYGRLRIQLTGATSGLDPFRVTLLSGTTGVYDLSVGASTFTSDSITDDKWHHYGFTFKSSSVGLHTRFYVDGELNNEVITGSGFQEVTGALQAYIGSLIAAPSGSPALAGYGKMSASLDEFRYWKTQRTSKGIGRYWFTQVGGGTNTDPEPFVDSVGDVNTLLGVYFKFNEGITGAFRTDRTVLDYSGRITNGTWTGYTPSSRNTGSAIVISAAAIKEYKDPIIYSSHPSVVALAASLEISGSDYDASNAANIYNTIPQWIREEDEEGQNNARYLTQIMASYFDDFQIKAQALTDLKSVEYPSGSQKPLPFAERLLNSHGFVAPDIFLDADILEKLADRSEFRVYEKTLNDVKNTIYQNIYNNLSYIYKTKGTEKSFRNLIRCFGIDDELVKINLYANDVEAEMRSNRKNVAVPDKFVNFNTGHNSRGTVVQYQNSSDTTNTAGFISGSGNLRYGYAFTLEAEVFFPQKVSVHSPGYQNTNIISSSLFGVHGNGGVDEATPRWPGYAGNEDVVNFQVYAVRDELPSDNVRFVLTGTSGLTTVVPRLASSLFEDVYADSNWNLAVRVRPESYPYTNVAGVTPTNYIVELHGINVDAGVVLNEFTVTGAVASPGAGREYAFVTGSRRVFAGAHRTNFTGALRTPSDVKLNSCRYWLTYLDDATLSAHGHDTQNAGTMRPHFYAFPFNSSASFGEVVDFDTLVFNWEFSTNTSSNALGQFGVADESSGSNAVASATNGWLGTLLNQQYSARGFDFTPSSTSAIDKDYVIAARQTLPENIYSTDMVTVFSQAEQEVYQIDSRPINYYFAFEKSLYQNISQEILNYFATLKDLNTLIGAPANRYRQEYKGLKFLREKYFATVANDEIDFDKFYEFYKWFDSSLTVMLQQLVPASTDFASNVRTMIESHVLERSKYQSKFPFLESKGSPLIGDTSGTGNDGTAETSPEDFPQGTGFFANTAYTRRQIGSSNVIRTKEWSKLHAPPDGDQDKNSYWWQVMANRAQNPTLKGANNATNNARQELLVAIERSYRRQSNSPVRFGTEGSVTLGGVGFHPNKRPTFVMDATAPAGRLVPGTNLPVNIMLSFQNDVEELITTKDVYYPTYKQRLGFGINPDINRASAGPENKGSTKNRMDGNVLAPFSLYSSSVKTGFNQQVISTYHSGVMITNLHHDIVHTNDVPMQGPFTEKYVGGWQYRHQDLNTYKASNPGTNNLDNRDTRAEGWMLKLGLCHPLAADCRGALGIVGPQYPDASSVSGSAPKGYLFDRPKANLAREEYAKRPVNIRNIKMTTGSTIIGNYEHNYQVVQTSGRELNDPYFNDQSFNFAPYPETLATRGRFPLWAPASWTPSSLQFDGVDDLVTAGTDTYWKALIGGAAGASLPFSVSFWLRPTDLNQNQDVIWAVGNSYTAGRTIGYYSTTGKLQCRIGSSFQAYNSVVTLTLNNWHHVVVTYEGAGASAPKIYVDGTITSTSTTTTTATIAEIATYGVSMGRVNGSLVAASEEYLCDVAVWSRELNADEADILYNSGNRVDISAAMPINLISWWKLGDGSGDSTAGSFANQVAGAPSGTPSGFPGGAIQDVSPPSYRPPDSELPVLDRLTTANPGGNLNYTLPSRTGSNSNQTVIVNRFAGCGYEVMSRGYMDPAHEELSVYNALPYRNLAVIDYGLSGSASVDPVAARTITVVDQIGKNRGLDQRATLHCGQFGHDAAYGSVPASTYVTTPSWHKTNRNALTRPNEVGTADPPVDAIAWGGPQSTGATRLEVGNGAAWDAAIGGTYNSADPIGSGTAKDWTIATWLYIEAYDTSGTFVWQVGGSSNKRFYMNAAGTANLRAGGVGQAFATTFGLGQWYHVVCTYDNSTNIANAYVDGILDANFPSLVGDTYDANSSMALGWYRSTPGGWDLIGQLAEFLVYDRALTTDEISELYRGGVVPVAGQFPTTNLIARYAFSAEAGDTVANIYNQGTGGSSFDSTVVLNYILSTASASLSHPAVPVYSTHRVYDNLYVQHQIPRSAQQYSWISASLQYGHTIFDLEAPSCTDAHPLSQLASGATMPQKAYYSASYEQNFQGWNGRMVIDHVDTSTHTLAATKVLFPGAAKLDYYAISSLDPSLSESAVVSPLEVGTYSARFKDGPAGLGIRTPYFPGAMGYYGSSAIIGTAATWDAAIGGSGVTRKPMTFACWLYLEDPIVRKDMYLDGNLHATLLGLGGDVHVSIISGSTWSPHTPTNEPYLSFWMAGGAEAYVIYGDPIGSKAFPLKKWNHIAITYAGGDPNGVVGQTVNYMKISVNGVENSQMMGASPELNNPSAIAGADCSIGRSPHFSRYLSGDNATAPNCYIADAAMWDDDLSAAQITALYNGARPIDLYTAAPDSGDLRAWWRFNPFASPAVKAGVLRQWRGDTTRTVYNRAPSAPLSNTDAWITSSVQATRMFGTAKEYPQAGIALTRFSPNSVDGLNILNNTRNGSYGWPTWKQIRVGETPVARRLRKANKIGYALAPPEVPILSHAYSGSTKISTGIQGYTQGLKSMGYVDYVEQPIASDSRPIYFSFQDNTENSNPNNNIGVKVSYANNLGYFTHEGLNNRLNLGKIVDDGHAYNTIANFAVSSGLSMVANYGQRVYPAAENAYKDNVRTRNHFSLAGIWNKSRPRRSNPGLPYSNMSAFALPHQRTVHLSQSIWALDGHNDYTTTSNIFLTGGVIPNFGISASSYPATPGELQSFYSRYWAFRSGMGVLPAIAQGKMLRPSAMFNFPMPFGTASVIAGVKPVIAGDAEFRMGSKVPYQDNSTYEEFIRLRGKDFSIVPEFRISELMPTYVNTHQGDFLANIDNIFSLTGASIPDSSGSNFYKVYSNSDFLKYFSVIDQDLNEKRSGALTITRDKITLSCKGLLKLRPYKGFYPVERTNELARLFKGSWDGSTIENKEAIRTSYFRIPLEMTYAPGIMFNTIKSGIAVSSWTITNVSGTDMRALTSGSWSAATINTAGQVMMQPVPGREYGGVLGTSAKYYMTRQCPVVGDVSASFAAGTAATKISGNAGYVINKVPFETIYRPGDFYNPGNIASLTGSARTSEGFTLLYDTAPSGTLKENISSYIYPQEYVTLGAGRGQAGVDVGNYKSTKLYDLAIDNFLCATSDIFVNNFTNFVSAREEDFTTVQSGSQYTMEVELYRTAMSGNIRRDPATGSFEMYARADAFGLPIAGHARGAGAGWMHHGTFGHVTPSYFDGPAKATMVYTAQYTGKPTLDEVISNTTISYERSQPEAAQNRIAPKGGTMHIDSSYNFFEKITEVPKETTEQKFRWLIQSKYETPVLNLAHTSCSVPPASYMPKVFATGTAVNPATLNTLGIWHQHGKVPQTAQNGVFATIVSQESSATGSNSLAKVVGFPVGNPQRVGAVRNDFVLEEAVVAIPFRIINNQRKFISLNKPDQKTTTAYQNAAAAMAKYNFPPTLDFTKFRTVTPLLMYVFEFGTVLSQQDVADMWQNVLPSIGESFTESQVVVEEKELLPLLSEGEGDLRWMVFKVKKRVAIDFERNRRSMITPHTGALAVAIDEKYSYNWPYDYCSLVELAQIEENVQWASRDLHTEEPTVIEYVPQTPATTPGPAAAPSPVNIGQVISNVVPALILPPQLDQQIPDQIATPPKFDIEKEKPPRRRIVKKGKGKDKKR